MSMKHLSFTIWFQLLAVSVVVWPLCSVVPVLWFIMNSEKVNTESIMSCFQGSQNFGKKTLSNKVRKVRVVSACALRVV